MLIAALASGGLALLNTQTAPVIAENKAREQALARTEVMRSLGVTDFEEVVADDGTIYWRALDESGQLAGYVAMAYGKGYSSTLETVAGFDTDLKVAGLKIIFQQETPGLGTKSVEVKKGDTSPWFLQQFVGKDALTLAVTKDRGEIDAITGATITSRAVTNSVKDAALELKGVLPATPTAGSQSLEGDTSMTVDTASAEGGEVTQ